MSTSTDQQQALDVAGKIRSLSPRQKRALSALLRKKGIEPPSLGDLPPLPREGDAPVPLSFTQRRLWFLAELDGSSPAYNIPVAMRLDGPLDRESLIGALRAVVERHEVLRTRFIERDGVPYQHIGSVDDFQVVEEDLADREQLQDVCEREAATPFDLARDCLTRVRLLRLSDREHVLLVTMHHGISDGWSVNVFVRDLATLYEAFRAGAPAPLEPLAIQYADYSEWQHRWMEEDAQARQVAYWKKQLAGIEQRLSFPPDRERPPVKTYAGAREPVHCPAHLLRRLRELSAGRNVTLYMTLLAAYNVLLHRYTRETDLTVGTVTANRDLREIEGLIGFFANTLAIRADLSGDPTFAELLTRVKQVALEAYEHQRVPFEAVVEALNLERSPAHSPVFQTMLVLQEEQTQRVVNVGGLEVSPVDIEMPFTKFDLTFDLGETPDGLLGTVEYNTDLFDASTIRRFIRHFTALLESVVESPDQRISQLTMIDERERRQVLERWNDTARSFSNDRCLHQLFEEAVRSHPDRTALVDAERAWTYLELDAWANHIAAALRARGVGPDTIVGLCVQRSAEMVAGIYGILKAGGAYMPIDPAYPDDRVRELLQSSGARVALTQPALDAPGLDVAAHVIELHHDGHVSDRRGGAPGAAEGVDWLEPSTGVGPGNLAYVIYTSGSTGRPKGVMIEHRAAVNRIEWMQNEYRLTEADCVLQKTPFSFDVSVWEFFWPLLFGARLAIAAPGGHKDPGYLVTAIQRFGVTTLHFVPSMLRAMLQEPGWPECTSIRQVFCSGEALPADLCARHYALHSAPLHNLYGPTEAAVDVSHWSCPADAVPRTIPIGRPIQNIQLYVLNDNLEPQGVGCIGELYIAGVGLARGYLNAPEQTAERFVRNPFAREPDARMYRTGDLARWRADGTIEFFGRVDDQIKLRGFRIELGEIEHRLNTHPAVRASAVLLREDTADGRLLVAYVVLDEDTVLEHCRDELVQHLGQTLPEYMVPAAFVALPSLPVTAHGKLDRKSLPAPDIEAFARPDYVAPETTTERHLAELWAELIGFEAKRISAADNFFALGGHSLLIPVLVARLKAQGLPATVRDVFHATSLADLASRLDAADAGDDYQVPENRIPEGCTRITPSMLPLVELNQTQVDAIVAAVPGGAANVQDVYPLVSAQEGILFHHLLDPDNDPYLVSTLLVADDEAACQRFTAALQALVDRHDVMRTAVVTDDLPEPMQVVHRSARLPVQRVRLDEDPEAQARELLNDPDGIDLHQAPLLRLVIGDDPHSGRRYLIVTAHHIIEDATSLRLMLEELAVHMTGRTELLHPAPHYRDFVAHTLHHLVRDEVESHFRATLGDVREPTTPFGLRDVRGNALRYPQHRRALPGDLTDRIRAEAQRLRVSPACLFHAAWACVAAATTERDDVVFGTVMSGRMQGVPGVERMLGNFINTLPLRVRLADRSVRELVADVETGLQALIAREQSPLSLAQRSSGLDRDVPLFTSVVNFRHFERRHGDSAPPLTDDGGVRWLAEADSVNYPLAVSLDDFGAELSLHVQVDEAVSCETVMEHVEAALWGIVNALSVDDGSHTAAIELARPPAAPDGPAVAVTANAEPEEPRAECLHTTFETVAARTPDAPALVYEATTLRYAELNARANRLARHLRTLGVGPDVLVALCLPRSEHLVVSLLAVLKAGGAYVPVDPAAPVTRLQHILQDSRPRVVLTDGALPSGLDAGDVDVVDIHADSALWKNQSTVNLSGVGSSPNDLAYVIYTSGSTGTPKGVMVEHGNVARLFSATRAWFRFDENDVWTLFHSYAFDFSVWEIWGALLFGGRLVVVPQSVTRNPEAFYRLLCDERVTVLNQTPSAFRQLIEAQGENAPPHALRVVVFGGEALDVRTLRPWAARPVNRGTRLVNMYGITETTVHVTYRPIEEADLEQAGSPIGVAIPDLRLHVLDEHGQPVEDGAVGELFVGGAGVARGYLNRPELTAERFLTDPFCSEPQARMYRSGDLVRRLPDGSLEYHGRNDDQVKIRGFRIELGEIEATLDRHEAVAQSVVTARDTGEDRTLVAYVRPSTQWLEETWHQQIQDYLDQWQRVFDDEYRGGERDVTEDDLNLSGWESSYTGSAIAESDMREWVEGTVDRIRELAPKRLLEIGSGTGLLLFRYAPLCEAVEAIDLSSAALDYVQRGIAKRGWRHVHLRRGDALSVDELSGQTFDTVVINSVAQYFPNRLYFEEMLHRLLPLVEDGGRILIGDVRNLDLLQTHACAVERCRADASVPAATLASRVQRRCRQESELLFSPSYFARLPDELSGVGAVDLLVKRGVSDNEMLAYRYDVIITKGAPEQPQTLPWLEAADADELLALLAETRSEPFGVRGILNPRITDDVGELDRLSGNDATHEVAPLLHGERMSAQRRAQAQRLEEALREAEAMGYRVAATWSQDRPDALDVVFGRGRLPRVHASGAYNASHLTNFPRIGDAGSSMARTLKDHLSRSLPDYMVPGAFVLVERIPLTINGKVDRRALPPPDDDGVVKEDYVAPRTPVQQTLCRLIADVLGLERVGLRDGFFELGGHSLVAVRLVMRIKNELGRELPLKLLLTGATVEEMAAALEEGNPASAGGEATTPPPPAVSGEAGEAPLSLQQRDLWFLERPAHLGLAHDNVQFAFRLEGALDREAYARSVRFLVQRHAILRTSFVKNDGELIQWMNPADGFDVAVASVADDVCVAEWMDAERQRPFHPGDRFMIRVSLLALSATEHVVVVTRPWGIFDGWSVGVFLTELRAAYRAFSQDREPELAPLPLQYADFARWQHDTIDQTELDRQREYWRQQLAGLAPCLSLHTDYPRPPVKSYRGAAVEFAAPAATLARLKALGREQGASLYMTLLAAFAVLVGHYSDDDELVIGSPFTNRPKAELEPLVGYFVNHLALRLGVDPSRAFSELLAEAVRVTAEAHDHKDLPFVDVARAVTQTSPAHSPVYQVLFNLLPLAEDRAGPDPADLPVHPVSTHAGTTRLDLSLTVRETAQGLQGSLEYSTDLFSRRTAERMARCYERLLTAVAGEPGQPLSQLWRAAESSGQPSAPASGDNRTLHPERDTHGIRQSSGTTALPRTTEREPT
ncbi:amino acid adenylation domain-containing protein [Arhodomonas sp. AD133]|uniref:amino acid adenylation domain-containing protein n=1 Tax=Arhodomonas sp. AD133 TaxID=3415009 RepID=UPI003EBF8584